MAYYLVLIMSKGVEKGGSLGEAGLSHLKLDFKSREIYLWAVSSSIQKLLNILFFDYWRTSLSKPDWNIFVEINIDFKMIGPSAKVENLGKNSLAFRFRRSASIPLRIEQIYLLRLWLHGRKHSLDVKLEREGRRRTLITCWNSPVKVILGYFPTLWFFFSKSLASLTWLSLIHLSIPFTFLLICFSDLHRFTLPRVRSLSKLA